MNVKPGQIGLYKSCRPPLKAGGYTLRVGHALKKDGDGTSGSGLNEHADNKVQKVQIEGPRFILAPDEVHSMFPPANDRGNFCNRLPQIVLRRRTLPWERTIDGEEDGASWMALLLVNENERENEDYLKQMTVAEVVQGTSSVKVPDLSSLTDKEKERTCTVVEMNGQLFKAICPTAEELNLLTHVRVVSTEDKELLGQDEDGWFSVVTGSRFPDKDLDKADGVGHTALLVSLEGQSENMTKEYSSSISVRLVVLASWSFTSKNEGDFQTTLTNIGRRGGVGLLGDLRHNCVVKGSGDDERNTLVIETSHVPVNQSYRTGEQGVGLYRGPLTPFPITYKSIICHHADEAIVVDPFTGLEQIGYGAAFELGRLLGASDESLAVGLMKWRRGDYDDGQNHADGADLLVELEIPELREKNPFEFDFWSDLMDPLGPLINPGQDFVSNPGNIMDRCGMSTTFVHDRLDSMISEIAEIENVSQDAVRERVGRERIFDRTTTREPGSMIQGSFNTVLEQEMAQEMVQRQAEVAKAVDAMQDQMVHFDKNIEVPR